MNKYMNEANQKAIQNLETNNGGPFGCTIVKDGIIIASSGNNVLRNTDPTAHAEIETIRLACKNLNTHDLSRMSAFHKFVYHAQCAFLL